MYQYEALVTNVVDGDTFDIAIDLGFSIHYKARARLAGIDTPEKNTQFGKAVWGQVIMLVAGRKLKMTTTKPDKYGRTLVTVDLGEKGDLAKYLISKGWAKAYDGGTKVVWTPEELVKSI